jgi:hypothetical protein
MFRSLLLLPLTAFLSAQGPGPLRSLTPAQLDVTIQDLAGSVSFTPKAFSLDSLFKAFRAKGVNEDAEPLLPGEFLALPEEARKDALHPDTACLLVLMLHRTAAWAEPERVKTTDWLEPVLIRANPISAGGSTKISSSVGLGGNFGKRSRAFEKVVGPPCPILEFRRNLPGPDPRTGIDHSLSLVGMDREARNWNMQHNGVGITYAPEYSYPSDPSSKAELENWIMARILVARASGSWDSPKVKAQFLKLAAPRIPAWDEPLGQRAAKATEALKQPASN